MMNKQEKIEQEINKTLAQFEKAEKLEPDPYFYTRLKARLAEKERRRVGIPAILKPVLLTILLLLNVSTAVWYLESSATSFGQDARQELVQLLSTDFQPQHGEVDLLNLK
ncbi:MAG: hypothetical protein Kow0042_23910 [Calditrichia bacterium]